MSWLNLIGIALGLAMDALAVAIAAGIALPKVTHRHVFRLAFHFGLFQFLMPIVGWAAGQTLEKTVGAYDHWIVFGVLSFIGGKMLWKLRDAHVEDARDDPTRGWTLVGLSLATSIDALAVGLSLALIRVSILLPSVVIGLVAGALTTVGVLFGCSIGRRFGKIAEALGGIVLIAIGLRVLLSH
ncbi:MAG: manganese efflux pump MntP family protein [Planctomycetota bacterium]|nr:manganese efflux pump MntP family protein [Planctomycetota bacterium]